MAEPHGHHVGSRCQLGGQLDRGLAPTIPLPTRPSVGLWASSPSEAWVPGAHGSGEAGRGFIALYDLAAEVPSCHFRYSHGTFRSRRGDLNPTRQWDKQEVTSSEEHVKWEVLSKPFSETTTCLVSHWGKKKNVLRGFS